MREITTKNINDLLFVLLGFFSSVYILMFNGTMFILYLSLIIIAVNLSVLLLTRENIKIFKKNFDVSYSMTTLLSILSCISAILFLQGEEQWKHQAVYFFFMYLIIYLVYIIIQMNGDDAVICYVRGFVACIAVQLVWCLLQVFLNKIIGVDINDLVFHKILNITSNASHYNYGALVPTGLTWHPGAIAPLLVIAYCFFYKDNIVKIATIIIAFLTQSSTCVLGIMVCVVFDLIFMVQKPMKKRKKHRRMLLVVCAIVLFYLIFFTDISNKIFSEVQRLFARVFEASSVTTDMASYYHKRYYTALPRILGQENIFQILFGIGYGCSGHPFTYVLGQYKNIGCWEIEAQIPTDLIERGIIGGVIIYYWMIKILVRGYKIDRRYAICITALLIESITYNVLFLWVVLFEMVMEQAVRRQIDIWDIRPQIFKKNRNLQVGVQ